MTSRESKQSVGSIGDPNRAEMTTLSVKRMVICETGREAVARQVSDDQDAMFSVRRCEKRVVSGCMADPFAMIAVQRRVVADLMSSLADDQWAAASLCEGWTVREVAAHLVMPFDMSLPSLMWRLAKARGNFNRVSDDYAKAKASAPTASLVATIRSNAEDRFTPPGMGPEAPLTDIVVHGLDIGVPLATIAPVPAETANTVLEFLMTSKATRGFVPDGRVSRLRFESTDTGWSAGSGPMVSGPAGSLVLALTGRRIGLDGLAGDGVGELDRRLN